MNTHITFMTLRYFWDLNQNQSNSNFVPFGWS